jgi:hypothetical protein
MIYIVENEIWAYIENTFCNPGINLINKIQ